MNPPPMARPTLAPVPFDLPCLSCRYNLRTLPADAICPECAMPIRRTLDHGWLMFCGPEWLRRIRSGFSFLLLTVLVGAIGIAIMVVYIITTVVPSNEPDELTLQVMTWSMGLFIIALWLWGVWKLTTPEPPANPGRHGPLLGRWIRALQIGALLVILVSGPISSSLIRLGASSHDAAMAGFGVAVLSWSAYALAFLLLLVHMRRLARRVVKPTLRKLMTFMLGGGIAIAVLALFGMIIATGFVFTQASAPAPLVTTNPAFPPVPTSMSVKVQPTAVSVSWSTPPTTGPTSAPLVTTAPTTAPAAMTPTPFTGSALFGMAGVLLFDLFVTVWGAGWLLAMVSFRRVLKQAIDENGAAAHAEWKKLDSAMA